MDHYEVYIAEYVSQPIAARNRHGQFERHLWRALTAIERDLINVALPLSVTVPPASQNCRVGPEAISHDFDRLNR